MQEGLLGMLLLFVSLQWEESSLGLEEKQSTPFPRQRSEPSLLPPDEEVADKK